MSYISHTYIEDKWKHFNLNTCIENFPYLDSNVPIYRAFIFQMILPSHVDGFSERKLIIAKLYQDHHSYHKLRRYFIKLNNINFN